MVQIKMPLAGESGGAGEVWFYNEVSRMLPSAGQGFCRARSRISQEIRVSNSACLGLEFLLSCRSRILRAIWREKPRGARLLG